MDLLEGVCANLVAVVLSLLEKKMEKHSALFLFLRSDMEYNNYYIFFIYISCVREIEAESVAT